MSASILGINIESNRLKLKNSLENSKDKTFVIATINANILYNAYINKEYRKLLIRNKINICDGSVVASINNLLFSNKINAYSGPDFFIDYVKKKKFTHAFIGSTEETLSGLKNNLIKLNKNLESSLFLPLPFKQVNNFDYLGISKKLVEFQPDIIWVSLGAPKQEVFSFLLSDHINRGVIIPVGAAFDFYSDNGKISRSPNFMRKLKLEWLYRLYKQPKKTFNRLIYEIIFMPIVFFEEVILRLKK